MQLMKQLGRRVFGAATIALGGALMLTAMSGAALAFRVPVPEIDPGSIASVATLLTGSLLVLSGRRFVK